MTNSKFQISKIRLSADLFYIIVGGVVGGVVVSCFLPQINIYKISKIPKVLTTQSAMNQPR